MAYDEGNVRWSGWWVAMWAVSTAVLVGLAFVLPFWRWLTAALVLFGLPEAVGLWRHKDALPPLTFVTRRYVPRWVTQTLVFALVGCIGAYWLGFAHPFRMGALFGLLGWAHDHFDVTYTE